MDRERSESKVQEVDALTSAFVEDEDEEQEEPDVVVIDHGSATIKCGFASDSNWLPQHKFLCIVGRVRGLRVNAVMVGTQPRDIYVGEDAKEKRYMHLTCPLDHGHIKDWEGMERVWHHAFYNILRVDPSERHLRTIVTEHVLAPEQERQRMARTLFETFKTNALCIVSRPLMSLYASGRTTGVVVHIGYKNATVVPIIDSHVVTTAVARLPTAGADLTDRLYKLVNARGFNLSSSAEYEWIESAKRAHCYVAQDFQEELRKAQENPALIQRSLDPEGQFSWWSASAPFSIDAERFSCPELLFNPSSCGLGGAPSLHQATSDAISECDAAARSELFGNIVLSGGTCSLPGLRERLACELARLTPDGVEVGVHALLGDAAYKGAAALALVPEFGSERYWVTKEQFAQGCCLPSHP